MRETVTKQDLQAHLDEVRLFDGAEAELPDPLNYEDLASPSSRGLTVSLMERRLSSYRPLPITFFDWPKPSGGYRKIAAIDPRDQVILRAVGGKVAQVALGSEHPRSFAYQLARH